MSKTRDNHYVPQWYQKGFLSRRAEKLVYLNLSPDIKPLSDGTVINYNDRSHRPTSKCFYQTDLYTTFFGPHINDDIETFLFGKIDDAGARAISAFIETNPAKWHQHFTNFFSYIDTQKIRTPKGLDWIRKSYPSLSQLDLMIEMQSIRNLHCTLWTEGVREIVSAEDSEVKFILSDHPVTIYNYACPPTDQLCVYPNDPSIALKASQTLFPLDRNHCLILTNLEYAEEPDKVDPLEKRTHARFMRQSLTRTDNFIRTRKLDDGEVSTINLILKSRAKRYIASPNEEWLFPEVKTEKDWLELRSVLLPPSNELFHFGGEIFVGFKDGTTSYQDAFGRQTPENRYLKKDANKEPGRNDPCGCGSGKKFKRCCQGKPDSVRPSWIELSIRERNIVLYRGVYDILGFNEGKTWDDVRRELSDEQIVRIHELYWSLWPIETDIYSFLPKPDTALRAVYTGLLDPRVVPFILSTLPYFDELLIQHPFVHPKAVNPDFSPIENPHKYKYQTLKNILFFLYLEPFVRTGLVNFFPDPCVFDNHLQHEMMRMADARRNGTPIDGEERKRYEILYREDFSRTIRGMPTEGLEQQIKKPFPDFSQEKIDDLIRYMQKQQEEDPLAPLRNDLFAKGGQLIMSSMAPNFEMLLFMAQLTGSAILTDSNTRWTELVAAQTRENGSTLYPWSALTDIINDQKFLFSANPSSYIQRPYDGSFGVLKGVFRQVLNASKEGLYPGDGRQFEADFRSGLCQSALYFGQETDNLFKAHLQFLIPKGGFSDNTVHRLLLKSGTQGYLSSAPLAIFFKPINW